VSVEKVRTHWKPFIADRVSEIQDITDVHSWRHVCCADNPDDYVSRGVAPQLSSLFQWWNGPDFLHSEGSRYDHASSVELVDVPELRAATLGLTSVEHSDCDILLRLLSFLKLQRVLPCVTGYKKSQI
jgi:hypothetical protein